MLGIYQQLIPFDLTYDSAILPKIKSKVIKILTYYSVKFSDDFTGLIAPFFGLVNDQVSAGKFRAVKSNDRLIQNVVAYYKSLLAVNDVRQKLAKNLAPLFEYLLLPNIELCAEDLETYEFEPETFVKEDLEETDQESRRRNCMQLVCSLVKAFPDESMSVLN